MSASAAYINDLDKQRRALEARLEDGYNRIGEAEATGKNTDAWFVFWSDLLTEYMAICDTMMSEA